MNRSDTAGLHPVHVITVIGGIYVTQSLIGAVMFMGVPAVLRDAGVPLDLVGLTYLLMLPWTAKFLWSPIVERYRQPLDGRRRSLTIVRTGQSLVILAIMALAFTAPTEALWPLLLGLWGLALIAATIDIACDAFTVEQLDDRTRGWGNVAQVSGGYIGITLGAGLFLVLVGHYGWQVGMLAMAAIAFLLTVPTLLTREPRAAILPDPVERPSLKAAFARAELRWGLVLVLVFQVGPRMVQAVTSPFLIDRGADLALLGLVNGSAGIAVSLAGIAIAGIALRHFTAQRLLPITLALHAITFAALLATLFFETPVTLHFVLVLTENAVMAGGFVVLYTAAMGWSSLKQAGIDFTLFQCADAAIAGLAGVGAATLAQHGGYGATFGLALVLALTALAIMPRLLRNIAAAGGVA